ncbi:MAG: class I SAM-dependent methyltransferase [Dehalococcoidales bacterium]|nr:class I SAM-dependent methyltransferase [Dehalococcoidales bacterium]
MNKNNTSPDRQHPGGNVNFWRNEIVERYDIQRSLISEKNDELLSIIIRAVNYFIRVRSIEGPRILDIGCGPGSRMTLSRKVLSSVSGSVLVGVDASPEMIKTANEYLSQDFGLRFSGFVGDFNSDNFWTPEIDAEYNFIVSNSALHYLSDTRRIPFMKECFNHLGENGVLVVCVGNRSDVMEIADMESLFRVEYTYNRLDERNRLDDFEEFKRRFEETEARANINWSSAGTWLKAMHDAGFKGADIIGHVWMKSVIIAVK